MTTPRCAALVDAVQTNCHIADARHAADLTLCIYLLQMREFYRWERGLPFGAPLARDAVGAWLAEREALWAALEGRRLRALPLPLPGRTAASSTRSTSPRVNAALRPQGLLYGAGLVGAERPVFFLAELHEHRSAATTACSVQVCGREQARGLFAPPAALDRRRAPIVLRRESLARWLLGEVRGLFGLRRADGRAFQAVAEAYGLDRDFDAALPRLARRAGRDAGAARAGRAPRRALAGPGLGGDAPGAADAPHRPATCAPCATTSPTSTSRCRRCWTAAPTASIHFWFASLRRRARGAVPVADAGLPGLARGDGGRALRRAMRRGEQHFARLARAGAGAAMRSDGERRAPQIERLLTSRRGRSAAAEGAGALTRGLG